MSGRLSARMEQLGSHWKDFHEIWYFNILGKRKLPNKFKFNSNMTRLRGTLHED
jgi:hypothetical protein